MQRQSRKTSVGTFETVNVLVQRGLFFPASMPQSSSTSAPQAAAPRPAGKQITMNFDEAINALFLVLTEKEATVIRRRFALQGTPKMTLEKIGKQFNVTRERIRQIESIALSKLRRTVRTTRFEEVNALAKTILQAHGGVLTENALVSEVLLRIAGAKDVDGAALRLAFSVDSELKRETGNTVRPYWHLEALENDDIHTIISAAVKFLKKRKSCMKADEFITALQGQQLFESRVPSRELIESCLGIDERLKEISEGWGLTEWRFVRPRSIRDKVEIILRKINQPLHFMDIANRIREYGFDHKNVTVQAVHNELIRYPQFVLVGRGLYALREWGYEPGTVADVIEKILKDKGPLSKKQIITEVNKQRQVKVGTISLNLQKMPYFVRVGRAVYAFDASRKQ